MKARGKKILLVTGTLEIILGLLSILGIVIFLMSNDNIPALENATGALSKLLILYAVFGINILGGLLAVIFADRPKYSATLMTFGFILILMQVYTWTCLKLDAKDFIINIVAVLIPCYYFYGAVLNYKDWNSPVTTKKIVRSTASTKAENAKATSVKKQATKPATKKTTSTKKAAAKPATKKATTTKKAATKPATKKTTSTKKATAKPATKKATTTKKAATKPATKKTTSTKKATTKPTTKKTTATKKTTTKKVATKTTAKKTTSTKKPVAKKTTTTKRTTTKKK